jgi:3-carboxy-cis,cis-muconate cycloisomerase
LTSDDLAATPDADDSAERALARAARRVADGGEDLVSALDHEPELSDALSAERLHRLADPTTYLGSAGALVDQALHAREAR